MVLDEEPEEAGGNGYRARPAPDADQMREICAREVLSDPAGAAPDMEYILHPEEIADLEWRMVDLPIEALFPPERLDEARELPGETPVMARRRWAAVRGWMEKMGGAATAIEQSPIIAMIDDNRFGVLDGWHRCVVAQKDYGLTHVRVALGMAPEIAAEYRADGLELSP